MAKNKGLGRGLDALLDEIDAPDASQNGKFEVDLYDIDTNPDQPRKTFDSEKLAELTQSIKRHGVRSWSRKTAHGIRSSQASAVTAQHVPRV